MVKQNLVSECEQSGGAQKSPRGGRAGAESAGERKPGARAGLPNPARCPAFKSAFERLPQKRLPLAPAARSALGGFRAGYPQIFPVLIARFAVLAGAAGGLLI